MFDDDAHKALPGEELNFVQVPCWDDTDDNDDLIRELVEAAKQVCIVLAGCTSVLGWGRLFAYLCPILEAK